MSLGPIQLLVVCFEQPDRYEKVLEELERLRRPDLVRVIDALAVFKDVAGVVEVEHLTTMTTDDAAEFGDKVAAMIAPGGDTAGRTLRRVRHQTSDGHHVLGRQQEREIIEDLPNGSAAVLILLEHHWAVPLRDALVRAGGDRIDSAMLTPLDVVEIGTRSVSNAEMLTGGRR